jgi:hypothetical protein
MRESDASPLDLEKTMMRDLTSSIKSLRIKWCRKELETQHYH